MVRTMSAQDLIGYLASALTDAGAGSDDPADEDRP
jgi:hypothetical protein